MRVGNRLCVGGRNGEADLRLGDEFEGLSLQTPQAQLCTLRPLRVRLRVERILAYRRYLNQLSSGMTAELELSGAEVDLPRQRFQLHGRSALPLFDSVEVLGSGAFHLRRL